MRHLRPLLVSLVTVCLFVGSDGRLATAGNEGLPAAVTVYETSEMIVPTPTGGFVRTAPILGAAQITDPLCAVVKNLSPNPPSTCTVTGSANRTSDSPEVSGRFGVVVEAAALGLFNSNRVDSPEFVVTTADFSTQGGITPIQLPQGTPAGLRKKLEALNLEVLLHLEGELVITYLIPSVVTLPARGLTGVFRLPFALSKDGKGGDDEEVERPRPGKPAFYLGDDGRLIRVQPDERSIGYPTPRLEVTFH